jgi:transposase-like protein
MARDDRERKQTQAQAQAVIRSVHLRGLSEAGAARTAALAEADKQLDRIARLLHDALQGGVSVSEISRVTGVSRQTLYELRARYGDTRDLRLAVLQGLLMQVAATVQSLAEDLKRPESEITPIVEEYAEKGFVSETPSPEGWTFGMTRAGLKALQEWAAADDPTSEPLWEEQS